MRKSCTWVIVFVCAGVLLPLLGAQSKSASPAPAARAASPAPAASAASAVAISDTEADQIMEAITSGDWEKAQPAVKKIDELNAASKTKLVPRLIDAMGITDRGYWAEEALAQMGAPVLPALEKVAQSATGQKQQFAVGAIGDMKTAARSAIPLLLTLAKSEDKDLLGWVIPSLGKIGPAAPNAPTIAPTLAVMMAALNNNLNGCESALGDYGAPAVPGLRKLLQTSTDSQQRMHAIEAFSTMKAPAAPATPELMAAIKNPAERVKAIWALVQIGPGASQAMPVLKRVVLKDPEVWAAPAANAREDEPRKYAMRALVEMNVDSDFLIQAMKDNAPGAMDALSKSGAAVLPAMRTMLSDSNLEYRKDALSVLGGMGAAAAPAVPDIVQKMADKDLSTSAISALGNIGPTAASAVPDIVKKMAEKDLCSWATSALGKMGPAAAPAVPALINVLYDEDNRYNAELALAAIGPAAKDAVPYLIDVLQGKPQFTVQPPAAGSEYKYGERLGEIGRIGMNVFSQDGAKDALTKIGTPEALAAVKQYDAAQQK